MPKTIYSRKIAYQLRLQGFKILKVIPNPYKPQYDAYLFEDTNALQEALDTIFLNSK